MSRAVLLIAFLGSLCLESVFSQDTVTVETSATEFEYNKDVYLTCNATITSRPTIHWYHNGEEVITGQGTRFERWDNNGTLKISHAVEADVGEYTCNFTLDSGTTPTSHGAVVNLNAAPFVKDFESASKNLVQGDPLVLTCKAWGYPPPQVEWFKSKEATPDVREKLIADGTRIKITTSDEHGIVNDTLRIENLDDDDRANYICEACIHDDNLNFPCANSTILLRVKDKLAALWPFLGICFEVVILCIIIFVYEHRRAKKMAEEEPAEETGHLTNSNDHKGKDDVRHRK